MREIKDFNDFNQVINQDKPVLLDFFADWCGPCRALLPTVEQLAEEHKEDFIIAKVNVDKNPEVASQFGVRSIPALFFLQNGKVVENLVGLQSKATLKDRIQKYTIAA